MKNIKILTNWWWEILIKPLEKYFNNINILWLNKDKLYHYNDYNSFLFIKKELKNNKYDLVHLNCWFDLFFLNKKRWVNYIFESHSIHPGISLKYSILFSESFIKKIIIFLFYPFFKLLFIYKIKKIDLYLVSIPWLLDLTKKYHSIWLPNWIDTNIFYKRKEYFLLNKNNINIFYPTWLREVKNPDFAFYLFWKIIQKYNNAKIYMIKHTVANYKKYNYFLDKYKDNIIFIDKIERLNLPFYYSADWDLVFWSFYPKKPYAILNMIEMEAMACKAPIIVSDLNELIFKNLDELDELAFKLLEDKNFKKEYIEKNYEYVKNTHSLENIAKIYLENLKPFLRSKLNLSDEEINSLSINN